MLLYEVWTGKRPFDRYSEPRIRVDVVNGKRPDTDPQVFHGCQWEDLMKQCWSDDPDEVGGQSTVCACASILNRKRKKKAHPYLQA